MLKIDWTKVNHDTNGNPRYVCHFLQLCTEGERKADRSIVSLSECYARACRRANQIGGRKFHNKQYGGGIVFQSYSLEETERAIERILSNQ